MFQGVCLFYIEDKKIMIVFDLDDTLFKEIEFVKSGYRAIGAALEAAGMMSAVEAVHLLDRCDTMARGFDELAARLVQKRRDTEFTAQWMVETYRHHSPDIKLSADAYETLAELRDAGVCMGLITDGRASTQRAKIAALGLDEFISPDNILISGETGFDKNSDFPFRRMMERNRFETRFAYLGDNPAKDFRWPNHLGWLTVQLRDSSGSNIHSQQVEVPADYHAMHQINNIRQILEFMPL